MIEFIKSIIFNFYHISYKMAPFLLIGFFISGLLNIFFKKSNVINNISGNTLLNIIKSSIYGIPLPLCSCGVIPVASTLNKYGVSKGATVSFLISTPQTGIDSFFISYSLLGLPFTLLKIFISFISGIVSGISVFLFESKKNINHNHKKFLSKDENIYVQALKYGFYDLPKDIGKTLIVGLLIAGTINALIPDGFIDMYLSNKFLSMILILLASIPMYVCAAASIPIALAMISKGFSIGAALVFLIAGPATNLASVTTLFKILGKKTTVIYIISLIISCLTFGMIVDVFFADYFLKTINPLLASNHEHQHHMVNLISVIVLFSILINAIYYKPKRNSIPSTEDAEVVLNVKGMTCSHCEESVKEALNDYDNIKDINIDMENEKVSLFGSNINLKTIKKNIQSLGFKVD